MVEDIDILRSAHLLIQQHGDQAAAFAARKYVDFMRAGGGDGMTVWTAIMQAILELTEAGASTGERLN